MEEGSERQWFSRRVITVLYTFTNFYKKKIKTNCRECIIGFFVSFEKTKLEISSFVWMLCLVWFYIFFFFTLYLLTSFSIFLFHILQSFFKSFLPTYVFQKKIQNFIPHPFRSPYYPKMLISLQFSGNIESSLSDS